MSELILGALSFLLGYMIIRFVMALLRKRASPQDHTIAMSLTGVVFCAALILLVGFAYGADEVNCHHGFWPGTWTPCSSPRPTALRTCWSIDSTSRSRSLEFSPAASCVKLMTVQIAMPSIVLG